ncbi:MAG: MFS transporter [Pasteurellaceae bacterium]|nr:MFS transporter [Pasteurellaceae bacterium]
MLIYKQIDHKQVIQPEMFTIIMGCFAIIAFILYQLCWVNSIERVQLVKQVNKQHARENCFKDLREIFSSLRTNKPLISFIAVAIILLLVYLLIGTMNPYLYIDYFNSKLGLSIRGMFPVIITFIIAPFTQKIVKRFGKKESSAIALLSTGIIFLLLYFIKIKEIWVYLSILSLAFLGFNYFMVIVWAFITDIIDNQFLQTNRREEGTIYAVYSFARKIGQALAGGLGGITLSAIGYIPNIKQQTPNTLDSIYSVATLIPAIASISIFLNFGIHYQNLL